MASLGTICPDCSGPASRSVGQSFAPGVLVWWDSLRCRACGMALEADDYGLPPEELRQAILDESGYHLLTLSSDDRVKAIHTLNATLVMPWRVQAEMMKRLPGTVLGGTSVEMEWLKARLDEAGIESLIRRGERLADIDLSQCECEVLKPT